MEDFNLFVAGYAEAMLFATVDDSGESEFLDGKYCLGDIDEHSMNKIKENCKLFWQGIERFRDDLDGCPSSWGYDFFMESHGHGVGFRDRDYHSWREAEGLSTISKRHQSINEIYAENGKVFVC